MHSVVAALRAEVEEAEAGGYAVVKPLGRAAARAIVDYYDSMEVGMDAMSMAEYQARSRDTWGVIDCDHPIVYPTLGLTNEAGELAGKIKKIFRDKGGEIGDAERQALKEEAGDCLWYLTQIIAELGLTLEEVAAANIAKLADRKERGVIQGEGDRR